MLSKKFYIAMKRTGNLKYGSAIFFAFEIFVSSLTLVLFPKFPLPLIFNEKLNVKYTINNPKQNSNNV